MLVDLVFLLVPICPFFAIFAQQSLLNLHNHINKYKERDYEKTTYPFISLPLLRLWGMG